MNTNINGRPAAPVASANGAQTNAATDAGLSASAGEAVAPLNRVRWGYVFAVVIPLIVLNGGWIANSEMRTGVTEVTISTLFMGVTFALFVLTLLNLAVRRLVGIRAALNQTELMALYSLLSLSSVVGGVGHFGFFLTFLANPFYYNTPANNWQGWWYLLPSAIGPRDPAILKGFYNGHSTAFQADVLRAWAGPMLYWCGFFLLLLWTTLCLSAILRRRWADEERLPFPILVLPLEMTRDGAPLYRNRLLWIGFAIPSVLHCLNSLQSMYPTLPYLHVNAVHDMVWDAPLLYPWNAVGSLFYLIHGSGIGFGYLVNTDVSFSLWFFYLLKKLVTVWAASVNLRDASTGWFVDANQQFPYFSYQGWGAWLILGVATLWTGRRSFMAYLNRALDGDRHGVDRNEAMSARLAVFGFVAGFLGLCTIVWSWGGSWWLPIVFLGIYLLLMVTLSRIRAEMAVLSTELVWINPQSILPALLGTTNGFSQPDLVHMATLSWFNTDYRASGMPHELEGLVGLERTRTKIHPMVPAILLAAAIAMVSSLLWDLQMYYANGAATGFVNNWRITKGSEPWNDLQGWLQGPKPPDAHAIIAMVIGAAITALLAVARARFIEFPLHPAAFALNMSFANDFFWCDMLIAWIVKVSVLRYGGMKLYRQMMPFFLGMILGDFVTGSAWSIFGSVFHLDLFRTFAI
jgi:hypothetical protein